MKKFALTLIVCALAVPVMAANGYVDTQDYWPGNHGVGPFGAVWTSNFGGFNEATSVYDTTNWIASNNGVYADEGVGIDWHGVYVGSSGDYNHVVVEFMAMDAITLQDWNLKVLVQRGTSTTRNRDMDMYASVSKDGGVTWSSEVMVFDMSVETGDQYGAGAITTDPLWGSGYVMNGAEGTYTSDVSGLDIQAMDLVRYKWKMQQNSPNGSNSKQMGLAVSLQDVPEPATMSLLGVGALALIRRKK